MNMFLHNINYDKFDIDQGSTLMNPKFGDDKPFDASVSNPPCSVKWIDSDDTTQDKDNKSYDPAAGLALKIQSGKSAI